MPKANMVTNPPASAAKPNALHFAKKERSGRQASGSTMTPANRVSRHAVEGGAFSTAHGT